MSNRITFLKSFPSLLFCCSALIAGTIQAEDKSADHRQLVRQMVLQGSVAELFIAGLKAGIAGDKNTTAESTKLALCVGDTLDRASVENRLIDKYLSYFSPSQASEIVAFYQSPTGRKMVAHWSDLSKGKIPLTPGAEFQYNLSGADQVAKDKFMDETDGGRRLIEVGQAATRAAIESLKPEIFAAYGQCRASIDK